MHQQDRQPAGPFRLRLPVAMAQHAAAIRWINLDSLRPKGEREGFAPPVVPGQGLGMAATQPWERLERDEPIWGGVG